MEHAIHIQSAKELRSLQTSRYQRIYYGVEFCHNLFPALSEFPGMLSFIKTHKLTLTLLSPLVNEQGLAVLRKTFDWLGSKRVRCEVVVNDWGVLYCLHKEFNGLFEIVLGRLLVRQHRDPEMKRIVEKQPPVAIKNQKGEVQVIVHKPPGALYHFGMQSSYVNSKAFHRFARAFDIKRIELNNLMQGINLRGINVKKSLYTPFVHVATTRFCPMKTRFQKIYRINVCRKECRKYYEILRHKLITERIYKKGNTTFYKNPVDMAQLPSGIDRIVFQAGLLLR